MEVRIVKKSKKEKESNKIFVHFTKGKELENTKKELQYIKNDVVFVEKDSDGVLQIKEYHTYDNLIKCLDKENKNQINKSLLINKFTNIFNLGYSYSLNENEKRILDKIKKDMELIKDSLENRFKWLAFPGEVNDKLIIGLGNHSVFETGITLHHTYGMPYIPGSALKGALKNYIIEEYFKECMNKCDEECSKQCEESANKDSLFIKIFGGENDRGESVKGNVIFMDCFPNENFIIKRDIMTPHHKDYYGENEKLPLDSDETSPIHFLVVEENNNRKCTNKQLAFEINIGIDKYISKEIIGKKENESINSKILEKYRDKEVYGFILENLIDALNFHGIGAKTSVGYGYFNIDKLENSEKNESIVNSCQEEMASEEQLRMLADKYNKNSRVNYKKK